MKNHKVIPFPIQKSTGSAAGQTDLMQKEAAGDEDEKTDKYVSRLRAISCELKHIAALFEITIKEVIADFTYIIVGDEIVSSLMEDEDDDENR